MKRRQLLQSAITAGAASLAGCAGDLQWGRAASPVGDADAASHADCTSTPSASAGPGSPYDSLTLYQVPSYVTEYSGSVVIQYDELVPVAQRPVRQARTSDGTYRQCSQGQAPTGVMTLFSHIERRWAETGGESFKHTYLDFDGLYYGITLVQEGDFIRVDSIPCTARACPTTPTPPPGNGEQ